METSRGPLQLQQAFKSQSDWRRFTQAVKFLAAIAVGISGINTSVAQAQGQAEPPPAATKSLTPEEADDAAYNAHMKSLQEVTKFRDTVEEVLAGQKDIEQKATEMAKDAEAKSKQKAPDAGALLNNMKTLKEAGELMAKVGDIARKISQGNLSAGDLQRLEELNTKIDEIPGRLEKLPGQ